MSIDLNWETVTGGPDGQELAHKIRDFIHAKFQSIPLPRFIKSVTVHDFEFGSIPPEIEIKDITDPLPDFYEENSDIDDGEDGESDEGSGSGGAQDDRDLDVPASLKAAAERRRRGEATEQQHIGRGAGSGNTTHSHQHLPPHINLPGQRSQTPHLQDLGSPFLGVSTPGIPGGTSSLHYFHSQFTTGLSGTHTPLAAVASAQHLGSGWLESSASGPTPQGGYDVSSPTGARTSQQPAAEGNGRGRSHVRNPSQSSISIGESTPPNLPSRNASVAGPTPFPGPGSASGRAVADHHQALREKHSVSTLAPTSVGTSRPPTRDAAALAGTTIAENDDEDAGARGQADDQDPQQGQPDQRRFREPRVEDMQAVFRIRYAGDIKLLLTTDILLDYPMPSFVGIPVRLSITGLTFDGVGVLAYIRRRVHFCFLSPEDALAAVGADEPSGGNPKAEEQEGRGGGSRSPGKVGGLLQEIRVESEIGQRESGKQSLKNVGKVERFVLEQVRKIFEEEFVYPSFWTFLV